MNRSIFYFLSFFILVFHRHSYALNGIKSYLNSGEIEFSFVRAGEGKIVPKQLVVFDLFTKYQKGLEVDVRVLDINFSKGLATQQSTREYFLQSSGNFLLKSQSIQVFPSYSGNLLVEGVRLAVTVRNKSTGVKGREEIFLPGPSFEVEDVGANYDFVASGVEESLTQISEQKEDSDALVFEYKIEASQTSVALLPQMRFKRQDDVSFYYEVLEKDDRFDRGEAKSIIREKITVVFNRAGSVKLEPTRIRYFDIDNDEIQNSELQNIIIHLGGFYFSTKTKLLICVIALVLVFVFYLYRLNRESLAYFYNNLKEEYNNRRVFKQIIKKRDAVGLINYLYRFAHDANELTLMSFFENYGIDDSAISNISNEEAIVGIEKLFADLFLESKQSEDYWPHFERLSLKRDLKIASLKYGNHISELN